MDKVRELGTRFWTWLPDTVNRPVRVFAWLSLIFQLVLIGTGGAVRLTGSGLGCPTWPQCTDDSLVNTPEMGIHGIIEFGNRTLTGVLAIIAICAFLSVIRMRKQRPDLVWLTFLQGMSIPLQAVIGGITVLTGLNSFIVGFHLLVSVVLVVLTAALVYKVYNGRSTGEKLVVGWYYGLAHLMLFFVGVSVIVGILTTGSGPHAGDADTPRNGLDPEFMQHAHSWPGYILAGLVLVLLLVGVVRKYRVSALAWLSVGVVAQIVLGIVQSRLGLPPLMVGAHMVLAGLVVAVGTVAVLALKRSSNDSSASDADIAVLSGSAH